MLNLSKEQGEAFCNTLNAFNAAWADRQRETSTPPHHIPNPGNTLKTYQNLHEALNRNTIRDYLGDEVKALREMLADSSKSGDYGKVDAFFDRLLTQKDSVEVVKVLEMESSNPKLPLAGRLNEFGKGVQRALNSMIGKSGVS